MISLAPMVPDAETAPLNPARLPGPAAALYLLHLRNTGQTTISGKVVLYGSDMLIGHYEDCLPAMRALKQPDVDLRQNTLILSHLTARVGTSERRSCRAWSTIGAGSRVARRRMSVLTGNGILVSDHHG